jgi:hypothetical protein
MRYEIRGQVGVVGGIAELGVDLEQNLNAIYRYHYYDLGLHIMFVGLIA